MKKNFIKLFIYTVGIIWGWSVFIHSQEFDSDNSIVMSNTVIASGGDYFSASQNGQMLKKRKKSIPDQREISYEPTLSAMPSQIASAKSVNTSSESSRPGEYISYRTRKASDNTAAEITTPNSILLASGGTHAAGKKLSAYSTGDLAVGTTGLARNPYGPVSDDGFDDGDGGTVNPPGTFNDAPVGDGLITMLLMAAAYYFIKKRNQEIFN